MKLQDIKVGTWVQRLCNTPYEIAGRKGLITAVGEQFVLLKNWDDEHSVFVLEQKKGKDALINNYLAVEDPLECIVKGCINRKGQGEFLGSICSCCAERYFPGPYKWLSQNDNLKIVRDRNMFGNEKAGG